jgi:hypothetical protein
MRKTYKQFTEFPIGWGGEEIVSVVVVDGETIIATNKRTYKLVDGKLERLELLQEEG